MITVPKRGEFTSIEMRILQRDFPLGVAPRIFKLNITNICNYDCLMCPYGKITKPKGYMNEWLFTKIVDRDLVRGQYVELFNFGEPFLHPKLIECCGILRDKNIKTLISTNASVGHNDLRGVLSNDNVSMLLCLESLDENVYKTITGGRLQDVLKFIDVARDYRLNGNQVTILVVESIYNRGHTEAVREKYRDFPVVQRLSDSFGGSVDEDIVFEGAYDKPVKRVPCIFPFVNCVVDWDGEVGFCCYDYDVGRPYGNLNDNSLKELWDGPVWTNLRKRHLSLDLGGTICENCEGWRDVLYNDKLYRRLVEEDTDNYYYAEEPK